MNLEKFHINQYVRILVFFGLVSSLFGNGFGGTLKVNASQGFSNSSLQHKILLEAAVSAGKYNDTDGAWTYEGSWKVVDARNAYKGQTHDSSKINDDATITINGSGFKLMYTTGTSRGTINVLVDGEKITTINQHSTNTVYKHSWPSPHFSFGNHLIKFVHASGDKVDIDMIEVSGPNSTPQPTATSGSTPINPTSSESPTPGETSTSETSTPTTSPIPDTPTPIPTLVTPSATLSPVPTETPTLVNPTATLSPTPTQTPTLMIPSATLSPVPTETPTLVNPTATLSPTPTQTPTLVPPSATSSPTLTQTPTLVNPPTTSSPTPTASPTLAISSTSYSPTPTVSPTPTMSPTPTITTPTSINNYYVDVQKGSDANPGSQSQPLKTIQKSVNSAKAGDTITVMSGNYSEEVNIIKSGLTINASGKVLTQGIYVNGDSNTVSGFVITDPLANAGIEVHGDHNLFEKNEIYHTYQDGIWFFGSYNIFRSNYIHDILDPSVTFDQHVDCFQTWGWDKDTTNDLFEKNICDHTRNTGSNQIVMIENLDNRQVRDLTFRNNIFIMHDTGYSPMNFHNQTGQIQISGIQILNNTFYNTTGAGQAALNMIDIINSRAINNVSIGYRSFAEVSGGSVNMSNNVYTGNYGMVDYPNLNFHLVNGSPLIDAGIDVGITDDFDGNPRPQGAGFDIGAYEQPSTH